MSRHAPALVLALAATLALGGVARAAGDYGLSATTWNGIGYLVETAREAKVAAHPVHRLDLSLIRAGDVLLWLYPERPLPVSDLLDFVRDGGYLVIADDRGRAGPLLAAAGISRDEAGPIAAQPTYEDTPRLPVLTPPRPNFLFFNLHQVVANYPAALRIAQWGGDLGPARVILPFAGDAGRDALVIERQIGVGRLLAIGDPSVLTNQMLRRFYGNKQFAANVMRLYCDEGTCPLTIVLPDATIVGHYRSALGRLGRMPARLRGGAIALNHLLARVERALGTSPWAQVTAWAALLVAALLLWRVVGERPRRPSPPLRVGPPVVSSRPRGDGAGLLTVRRTADFIDPARVLLAEMARIRQSPALRRVLGEDAADPRAPNDEGGDPAHTVVRHALLRIGREADSVQGSDPAVVSAERLLRLLSDVRTVSRYLDDTPHGYHRDDPGAAHG